MAEKTTTKAIAAMIDHSLLRPTLTEQEYLEGIEIARKYLCATVCVAPYDVQRSADLLKGSGVRVSTVVDFPHGSNVTEAKVFEAVKGIENGATELDMVLAISRLVAGDLDYVKQDIAEVVKVAHERDVVVKVIFENCYLNNGQIVTACEMCEEVGADYVKTSTGYGPSGATLEDIRLMRKSCSAAVSVKAAGGIRTLDQLLEYEAAGTRMIGTRSTGPILEEAAAREAAGTLATI